MAPEGGFYGIGGGSSGGTTAGSNIRVFVRWYEPTVFAGEDVRCRITFRNVAPKPVPPSPASTGSHRHRQHEQLSTSSNISNASSAPDRPRLPISLSTPAITSLTTASSGPNASSNSASGLIRPASRPRVLHRPSLSLGVPARSPSSTTSFAAAHRRGDSVSANSNKNNTAAGPSASSSSGGSSNGANASNNNSKHSRNHRRSLSIVSISSEPQASPPGAPSLLSGPGGPGSAHRPMRGHTRATSLQIGPRGPSIMSGPRSATNPTRYPAQPSPLFNSSYPPSDRSSASGLRGRNSGASTMPNTPSIGVISRGSPRSSDGFPDFKFPGSGSPSGRLQSPGSAPSLISPLGEASLPDGLGINGSASFDDRLSIRTKEQAPTVPTIYEGPMAPPSVPAAPEARILSTTSIAGTPRSSGEFYSVSNHSSETLASEYIGQQPVQLAPRSQHQHPARPLHLRHKSAGNLLSPPAYGPVSSHKARAAAAAAAAAAVAPETLMMGYAQIQGSFTLDGSLVNMGPFEQVKRKAVVGGQGGGVIGVETHKRESGLLRGFGWGSFTSSLGELLGGGEMSTIKEMRDIASSKSVPLLSTPQSVLFVDLKLAPGESKTYEYTFRLPKGLPPTHRGKVMKIAYGLVIGTQRPGTAKEQRVRSVEIPFRVLGSVNSHGEILGHDLMAPYILLRDQASIQAITDKERDRSSWASGPLGQALAGAGNGSRRRSSVGLSGGGWSGSPSSFSMSTPASASVSTPNANSSLNGFLVYVDELLKDRDGGDTESINKHGDENGSADNQRNVLLSPTATLPGSRRQSAFWSDSGWSTGIGGNSTPMAVMSAREAIDLAILRSNMASNSDADSIGAGHSVSANRFEIARNGRKVGTVLLARPAYRLGETVTMAVDFLGAELPCYAVHATLETGERILDPNLAMRSEASIQRVTRKVYASASEATLYSRRFVFTPAIPTTATPEFVTSGVSLEWKIRLEFVVPSEETLYDGASGYDDEADGDYDDDYRSDASDPSERSSSLNSSLRPRHPRRIRQMESPPLLEELTRDDRGGLVLVAAEVMSCESFEAAVPLRVYGWNSGPGGHEREEEIGMAV